MIFVCLGSREYQFNRLLIRIDELIKEGKICEDIFAQIGQSTYIPEKYSYTRFMSRDEFAEKQNEADIIISHGGTGALVNALKMGKKVIAAPRLVKYGEHIDDHQLEVVGVLENMGYLLSITEMSELEDVIKRIAYKENINFDIESHVMDMIINFIDNN